LELLRSVTQYSKTPVIASGGISNLVDVKAVSVIPGVEGVIIGKAIYSGQLLLSDALEVSREA
jgi:phosphoribosylformimino-5-aminoimidazole carboxamide ribonucleotide (ProFAR) isomerase